MECLGFYAGTFNQPSLTGTSRIRSSISMPRSQAQADVRLGLADARSPGGTDEAALLSLLELHRMLLDVLHAQAMHQLGQQAHPFFEFLL